MIFRPFFIPKIFLIFGILGVIKAAERPNIVIVFTDDQGYGDLACYGSEKNRTPRLDRLVGSSLSARLVGSSLSVSL